MQKSPLQKSSASILGTCRLKKKRGGGVSVRVFKRRGLQFDEFGVVGGGGGEGFLHLAHDQKGEQGGGKIGKALPTPYIFGMMMTA